MPVPRVTARPVAQPVQAAQPTKANPVAPAAVKTQSVFARHPVATAAATAVVLAAAGFGANQAYKAYTYVAPVAPGYLEQAGSALKSVVGTAGNALGWTRGVVVGHPVKSTLAGTAALALHFRKALGSGVSALVGTCARVFTRS